MSRLQNLVILCLQVIAKQQEETAALVDKQSSEMMKMMEEKKKEIEVDLVKLQSEIDEAVSIICYHKLLFTYCS